MRPSRAIVAYHAVGACPPGADRDHLFVSPPAFESQMEFLARRRQVVPLSTLLDAHLTSRRPAVAITFDDGFRNVLTEAIPVLERFGFTATLFVSTRWIDDPSSRDKEHGSPDAPLELLTAGDVAELARRGFDIGSHGHTHADLGRSSRPVVEAELRASVERLTELLGRPPAYLAWPYGFHSEVARAAARSLEFEAAFTTDFPTTDRYAISRVLVFPQDGPVMYSFKTSGRYVGVRRSSGVEWAYSFLRPLVRRARGIRTT